jgi:hypothetical protein
MTKAPITVENVIHSCNDIAYRYKMADVPPIQGLDILHTQERTHLMEKAFGSSTIWRTSSAGVFINAKHAAKMQHVCSLDLKFSGMLMYVSNMLKTHALNIQVDELIRQQNNNRQPLFLGSGSEPSSDILSVSLVLLESGNVVGWE